jgi:hypothetical protein
MRGATTRHRGISHRGSSLWQNQNIAGEMAAKW